jgi:hypothetical protein
VWTFDLIFRDIFVRLFVCLLNVKESGTSAPNT